MTKIYEPEGKDPIFKKLGIITLEDVLEEVLMEEIEDEHEREDFARKKAKEKLYLLFNDY